MRPTAVQCPWTDLGRDRSGWPLRRSPGRSKPSSWSLPHSRHPGRQRCPCQHYAPRSIHAAIVWLVNHRVRVGWPSQRPWQGVPCSRRSCPTRLLVAARFRWPAVPSRAALNMPSHRLVGDPPDQGPQRSSGGVGGNIRLALTSFPTRPCGTSLATLERLAPWMALVSRTLMC